jgi:uncharacterized damage-inducible protein DinB
VNVANATNATSAMKAEQAVPLAVVYQGWGGFNQSLVKVIAPLSAEQLALPTAQHHWSLGQAVQHLVANRAWWFHQWLGVGGADMDLLANWDGEGELVRSADELVAALESTWKMVEGGLTRWTVANLGDIIQPPATLTEEERGIFGPLSRQEIIWHVLTHQYHHAGELAAGMGWHGLPTLSGWGS